MNWLSKFFVFSIISFFVVPAFAQEQLSFIDNHYRSLYKSTGFFEYKDRLRAYTEEFNGAVTVYEYDSEEFVEVGKLNDAPTSMPWRKDVKGQFLDSMLLQVNKDHIMVSNLGTFETRRLDLEPRSYQLYSGFITYTSSYSLQAPIGSVYFQTWNDIEFIRLSDLETTVFSIPQNGDFAVIDDSIAVFGIYNLSDWDSYGIQLFNPLDQEILSVYDYRKTQFGDIGSQVIKKDEPDYFSIDKSGSEEKIFTIEPDQKLLRDFYLRNNAVFYFKDTRTDSTYLSIYNSVFESEQTFVKKIEQEIASVVAVNNDSALVFYDYGGDFSLDILVYYLYDLQSNESLVLDTLDVSITFSDTEIHVGDFAGDFYYYMKHNLLNRINLKTHVIEELGELSELAYSKLCDFDVIEYENEIFIKTGELLYKYNSLEDLQPLLNPFKQLTGLADTKHQLVHADDNIFIAETFRSKSDAKTRNTYLFNGSEFIFRDSFNLVKPFDFNYFNLGPSANLSPKIKHNIWATDSTSFGYLSDGTFTPVINQKPKEDYYDYLVASKDQNYILFVTEQGNWFSINTTDKSITSLPILDSLEWSLTGVSTFDSKVLIEIWHPEQLYKRKNVLIDLKSNAVDVLGDYKLNAIASLSDGTILGIAAYYDNSYFLVSLSPDMQLEFLSDDLESWASLSAFLTYDKTKAFISYTNKGSTYLIRTNGRKENTAVIFQDDSNAEPIARLGDKLYFSNRAEAANLVFDIPTSTLVDHTDSYPNGFIGQLFEIGSSDFAIMSIFDTPKSKLVRIEENQVVELFEFGSLTSGETNYVLPLDFVEDVRLGLFTIEPFGTELYYLHEDGTLEMFFDQNRGVYGVFESRTYYSQFSVFFNIFDHFVKDGDLYYAGITETFGKQIYKTPLKYNTLSSKNELPDSSVDYSITLSPNPASNFIHVELGADFKGSNKWTLIDIHGRTLSSGEIALSTSDLDLSDLNTGHYYLQVISVNGTFIKPFEKVY